MTQSVQLTEIGPQACIPGQEASPEEASLIFSHHSHDRHNHHHSPNHHYHNPDYPPPYHHHHPDLRKQLEDPA